MLYLIPCGLRVTLPLVTILATLACSGGDSPGGAQAATVAASFKSLGALEFQRLKVHTARIEDSGRITALLSESDSSAMKVFVLRDGIPESVVGIKGMPEYANVTVMSADGKVLGGAIAAKCFLWLNGTAAWMPTPSRSDFASSRISGISADGNVVVGSYLSAPTLDMALRWDLPDGADVQTRQLGQLEAAIGESVAAAVSPDGAHVYGYSRVGQDSYRFFDTHQGPIEDDTSRPLWPTSVNIHGVSEAARTIVGDCYQPEYKRWVAFRTDGVQTAVAADGPDGVSSRATSVAADGSRAVGVIYATGGLAPLVWDAGGPPRSLVEALDTAGVSEVDGWTNLTPVALSPDGTWIIGHGHNPAGARELWLVRLPVGAAA